MSVKRIQNNILIVLLSIFSISTAYCQQTVQTISGTVSSVNTTTQSLTINYFDQTTSIQNIQIIISKVTEIFDVTSLSSLLVGDDITVDYIIDGSANNVAVSLYKFAGDSTL